MKKTTLFLTAILLGVTTFLNAQLTEGSIAFSSFNSDGDDNFSFIAIDDIPANTTIYFTDRGWMNAVGAVSASFDNFNNEGTIAWNTTTAISAGTEIQILRAKFNVLGPVTASVGTIIRSTEGNFSVSTSADSVIAYIGTIDTPTTLLTAVMTGSAGFTNAGTSTSTSSELPTDLTLGVNAMETLKGFDNYQADCAKLDISTLVNLRTSLNTIDNYIDSNSTQYLAPNCTYVSPTLSSDILSVSKANVYSNGSKFVSTDASLAIEVYNTLGQKVKNQALASGIYILKVANNNGELVTLKKAI